MTNLSIDMLIIQLIKRLQDCINIGSGLVSDGGILVSEIEVIEQCILIFVNRQATFN